MTGGTIVITGADKAIKGSLKNTIAGTGWSDVDGTQGQTLIEENSNPESLSFKRVEFPAKSHTHDFKYELKDGDASTVVATCIADGCTDPAKSVSFTILKPAKQVYGDSLSEEATLKDLASFNSVTGLSLSTADIKYYKGDTELDAAPTDAGTYQARISVTKTGTAAAATTVTAYVEYEIQRQRLAERT